MEFPTLVPRVFNLKNKKAAARPSLISVRAAFYRAAARPYTHASVGRAARMSALEIELKIEHPNTTQYRLIFYSL